MWAVIVLLYSYHFVYFTCEVSSLSLAVRSALLCVSVNLPDSRLRDPYVVADQTNLGYHLMRMWVAISWLKNYVYYRLGILKPVVTVAKMSHWMWTLIAGGFGRGGAPGGGAPGYGGGAPANTQAGWNAKPFSQGGGGYGGGPGMGYGQR